MKNYLLFLFVSLTFAGTLHSQSKAPISWSGTVVDYRTGNPISGAKVFGGGSGRVDLTEAAMTDEEGRFTVVYESGALDLDFWKFYMLTIEPPEDDTPYFGHVSVHSTTGEVKAQLIPILGFIQGTVRDKTTKTLIAGARVSLGQPGRVLETVTTGPEGRFSLVTEAYNIGRSTNYEIGIAPENQISHDAIDQPALITDYLLDVSAEDYQSLQTADLDIEITLISSSTDEVFTKADIELSPLNASESSTTIIEQVDPTFYRHCISLYFSENQMSDPGISSEDADPDLDGLSNKEECQIGSHPLQSDSDEDGMLDGWEIANGTSVLEPDEHLDLDGDSFSNRLEFLYQSDANDANSAPQIELDIKRAVRVDVATFEGVVYQIQSSLNLEGPWSDRGASFDGDGTDQSFYFDAETESEVFKVIIADTNP